MTTFDGVWPRIVDHAGQLFRTTTGLPFHYTIEHNCIVPDRTGHPLHQSQVRIALDHWPVRGPSELNRLVRGPSYIYAILADRRIKP
jgi:hypothetical protein